MAIDFKWALQRVYEYSYCNVWIINNNTLPNYRIVKYKLQPYSILISYK